MQVNLNSNGNKKVNTVGYKYSLGDEVIFIDLQTNVCRHGEVKAVSIYHDELNNATSYTLLTDKEQAIGNVPESIIFTSRDELLNWAIDITNKV
jgi:hypothetical protein